MLATYRALELSSLSQDKQRPLEVHSDFRVREQCVQASGDGGGSYLTRQCPPRLRMGAWATYQMVFYVTKGLNDANYQLCDRHYRG